MLKRCESSVISLSVTGVTCASFRVTSRQENSSNCALSLAAPEIRSASATANARFVTLSLRVFTARVNLRFISCSAAASSLLSCAAALSCAAVRSFEGTRTAGSFRGADIRFGEERSPGNSALRGATLQVLRTVHNGRQTARKGAVVPSGVDGLARSAVVSPPGTPLSSVFAAAACSTLLFYLLRK